MIFLLGWLKNSRTPFLYSVLLFLLLYPESDSVGNTRKQSEKMRRAREIKKSKRPRC